MALQDAFLEASAVEQVDFLITISSLLPAMATGFELGMFDVLRKPLGYDALISAMNVTERATEVLLEALVGVGIIAQAGEKFVLGKPAIYERRPQIIAWKLVWERQLYYLTESALANEPIGLRKTFGSAERDLYLTRSTNNEIGQPWDELMNRVNGHLERNIAPAFDLAPKKPNVLDICGNAGANAIRVSKAYPLAHITVADLPHQVAKAALNIARSGMQDRMSTLPIDLLQQASSDFLGDGIFDVVYMLHAVSMFDLPTLARTFRAAHTALREGGVFMFDTFTAQKRGHFRTNYLNVLPAYFLTSAISTHGLKFFPDMIRLLDGAGFTKWKLYADGMLIDPSQEAFEQYDGFWDRMLYLVAFK